jgi:uncharacterized protein (DUF1778 family)
VARARKGALQLDLQKTGGSDSSLPIFVPATKIAEFGNSPRSDKENVLTLPDNWRILGSGAPMATQPSTLERRTEKLDLRISPSAKARLQAAATALRRPVSDFVLESALAQADIALADRNSFVLDADRWTAFLEALDAPSRPLPRLKALLEKPGYFDPPAESAERP